MQRDDRPYIVVANRLAGSGEAHRLAGAVEQAIGRAPFAVLQPRDVESFRSSLHETLARSSKRSNTSPLLVCIGGDGTLSLAFDALPEPAAATLAVVPCGSGNDLALMLGISARNAALRALQDGSERSIDFGTVNGRRFLNCVGIGLDAEVAGMAARIRARGLTRGFSYYLAALRGLSMVKPVGATVRLPAPERRIEDLVMLTVGNGRWYGGGFRGAPGALLDDGILDCYAFRDVPGLLARFALMQRIRAGAHVQERNVTALAAARISVEFDREIAMHVDGEPARCSTVDINVVPRGARVLVPAHSTDHSHEFQNAEVAGLGR